MNLVREGIAEPGRYYSELQTIVLRHGLRVDEERRYLWHEIVHADRGDRGHHTSLRDERSVEREALHRAMPSASMFAAWETAATFVEAVDLLKVPEVWVVQRLAVAHPGEKTILAKELDRRGVDFYSNSGTT